MYEQDSIAWQVLVEEKSRLTLNSQSALVARGSNNESKHKDKKKKKERCTYCSFPGHKEEDCRKKKKDTEEDAKSSAELTNNKPHHSAKVVRSTRYSETPIQLFLACHAAHEREKEVPASSNWIIDSGASAHMTCRREILTSYCPLTPPKWIVIGDISKTRVLCTTLDSAGQSHRAHREGSLCTALYSTPYKAGQRGTVHRVSWTTLYRG
jgi:hypothetical protein